MHFEIKGTILFEPDRSGLGGVAIGGPYHPHHLHEVWDIGGLAEFISAGASRAEKAQELLTTEIDAAQ
ncbi:MAG: hypothetical protein OXB96_01710 [Candidatus Kaiserbacteria bacterium]|nr:hypothetical protein [Candidatus Kaiserbacteria bacterium]